MRERSVGLGVMGFHSFLQQNNIPIEAVMAKVWNKKMFKHIRSQCDQASKDLARTRRVPGCGRLRHRGALLQQARDRADRVDLDHLRRRLARHRAVGGQRLQSQDAVGLVRGRNPYLEKLLDRKPQRRGHLDLGHHQPGLGARLDCLDDHEKAVFKTAFEIDQRWLIEHAADRTPYICQSQSLNIFLPADVHKRDLHQIHMMAWKRGVKTLYYCRSLSIQRADVVSNDAVAASFGDHALTAPLLDAPCLCRSALRRPARPTTTKSV